MCVFVCISSWKRCSHCSLCIGFVVFNLVFGRELECNKRLELCENVDHGQFPLSQYTRSSSDATSGVSVVAARQTARPGFHKVVGRLPWLRNNSSVQLGSTSYLVKHSIGQGAYAKIYQVFQTNNTDLNPSRSVLKVHDLNAIWEFSITSELLRTAPTKRKLSCCMSRTFLIEEYLNQLDDWIAIDKINP